MNRCIQLAPKLEESPKMTLQQMAGEGLSVGETDEQLRRQFGKIAWLIDAGTIHEAQIDGLMTPLGNADGGLFGFFESVEASPARGVGRSIIDVIGNEHRIGLVEDEVMAYFTACDSEQMLGLSEEEAMLMDASLAAPRFAVPIDATLKLLAPYDEALYNADLPLPPKLRLVD